MSTSPATVSVEYAKSGRSTCKGCGEAIASGALRLGTSTRGFDSTKWYHIACFPVASHTLGPVESINGIKDDDRQELRQLEKNTKTNQTAVGQLEEPSPKKVKTQASPANEVSDKASVSVEYAKSGRSTCKECNENIHKGALRIGASFHDCRGFENTKWYHVFCFPTSLYPVSPLEHLKGFDSIEEHDREKLQKLDRDDGSEELRQLEKDHKTNPTVVASLEESNPEKVKTQVSSPVEGVSDKASVSVEYAKSGRSTCKGCNENIEKAGLRIGASFHDRRGFENTKWYHVSCFPTSLYPVFPVEHLKGFDSIEVHDREKLQKLEKVQSMGDSKDGTEKNLEEVKLSVGNQGTAPMISFSASDVKDKYEEATLPAHWKRFNTVIFREKDAGLHASTKIAAFDFDGCLAKTNVRSIGADKWSLMHNSIPEKLQKLYNDGYKLVIFTNESNIERWKNKRQVAVDSKVGRLDQFIERVKVPIQVFIACGLGKGNNTPDDQYRKPNPGMWWLMAQHFNSGVKIDMDQSFYVGDAAGRKNDHSDADKEFAKAIGLKFHVPEQYFSC